MILSMGGNMISRIKRIFLKIKFLRQWRKNNVHNGVIPQNFFNINCVKVGNFSYGPLKVLTYDILLCCI